MARAALGNNFQGPIKMDLIELREVYEVDSTRKVNKVTFKKPFYVMKYVDT